MLYRTRNQIAKRKHNTFEAHLKITLALEKTHTHTLYTQISIRAYFKRRPTKKKGLQTDN